MIPVGSRDPSEADRERAFRRVVGPGVDGEEVPLLPVPEVRAAVPQPHDPSRAQVGAGVDGEPADGVVDRQQVREQESVRRQRVKARVGRGDRQRRVVEIGGRESAEGGRALEPREGMQETEQPPDLRQSSVMLGESFVLPGDQIRIALRPEPVEEPARLARADRVVPRHLGGGSDHPHLVPQDSGRVEVGEGQGGVVPGLAGAVPVLEEGGLGPHHVGGHVRCAAREHRRAEGVRPRRLLEREGDVGAVGHRRRVVGVACQRTVDATPDAGIVIELPEQRPAVAIRGRQGEDAEQRLAHDHLALVAPQVVAHPHLPVERLRIRRREPGGGAEFLQRLIAADHGPGEPASAQEEVRRGIARVSANELLGDDAGGTQILTH